MAATYISKPSTYFYSITPNQSLNSQINQMHNIQIHPPSTSVINHKTPLNDFNHQRNAMSLESLSMCTEGLGFESFDDDVEDRLKTDSQELKRRTSKHAAAMLGGGGRRRSSITGGELPPSISSLGRSGKPLVCLKSYRENGRFILKEVRIPNQELLHASREDGRLKLKFIQFHDDGDMYIN